jgi:myo-inositol-1(or 4)-monophosphatase
VACGRVDAFFEYNLSPWDLAAGALIVKEAGGKLSDFNGGNNWLFGKEIIATNASIYNTILPIITSNFSTTS